MSEFNQLPIPTGQNLEAEVSRAKIDQAFANLEKALRPLIQSIEERSPGNRFGARVYGHMIELSESASTIASSEKLTCHQEALLRFILGSHDVGRIICESQRPGDREYQHRHGIVGAEFLRESGVLSMLSPEEQSIVCNAVEQHSVKDVTLTPDTLEYRLCYILRDLDKAELFARNADFMEPSGVLVQIKMWMLSDPEKKEMEALEESGDILALRNSIQSILEGKSLPQVDEGWSPLGLAVISHLTRAVPVEYATRVAAGGLLTKPEMISGYPAYMLAQIAMYNDLRSEGVRAIVKARGDLIPRQVYLDLVDPAAALVARRVTL